jgi:hypothetical protein
MKKQAFFREISPRNDLFCAAGMGRWRPSNSVAGACQARQKEEKNRSVHGVHEDFFPLINDASHARSSCAEVSRNE